MHRAGALNPPYPGMTTTTAGPVMSYVRCFSLTVWFFSLVVGLWWRQEANDIYEMMEAGVDLKGYFYVGFATALIAHLTLGLNSWAQAPFRLCANPTGLLLTLFCLFAALTSVVSANYRMSLLYACATWGILLLCSQYWQNNYDVIRRMLPFTGVVLLAWIMILFLHHGQRFGGAGIGGINRNTTSHVALAGMVCVLLSRNKTHRLIAIGTTAFLATIVTSRGTVLAIMVFLIAYYSLQKGSLRAAVHGLLLGFFLFALLLAFDSLRTAIGEDLLRISSSDRGLTSGFSGRFDRWKYGLELFLQSPFVGHGFRSTAVGGVGSSHSGYLKILTETGMIGFAIIFSAILWGLYARVTQVWNLRSIVAQSGNRLAAQYWDSIQVNTIAASLICAILVMWVYEPIYINIGSPLSLCLFLMLMAPAWVSSSQIPKS